MSLVEELEELKNCQEITKRLRELGFKVKLVSGSFEAHGGYAVRGDVIVSWWHNPRADSWYVTEGLSAVREHLPLRELREIEGVI